MSWVILLTAAALQSTGNAVPLVKTQIPPPVIIRPLPPPQTAASGATTSARARANLASYVSNDDYPADAMRAGQQGTTGFRLAVGPDGRVTVCTILQSSGSASLDNATCRIMRSRARFTPATDASGNPISDNVNARIAWRLPRRTIPDLVVAYLTLGSDGVARNCKMEVTIAARIERREAADCGANSSEGPMLAAIRLEAKGAQTSVRSEMRLIRDAAAPWPQIDGPTTRVIARKLLRLEVEPGGRVAGCFILDSQGPGGRSSSPCAVGAMISGHSASQATEMRMVVFTAIEIQPAPR